MSLRTIQAGPALKGSLWIARRARARPLALLGAALAMVEFAIAALGGRFPLLSGLVLCLAPGLALIPLLPESVRASWSATLAAVPALGFAASSVAIVSLASAGVSLTGASVRVVLGVLVLVGLLLLPAREPEHELTHGDAYAFAGLVAALLVGILLQNRVIGHSPVPGNDWGQYVLYADEIRAHGSLLIQNPFWMFGTPFRQDPGVPAVFGSYLLMGGQPAGVLMHGIWVFAVMGILSMFALARALWGELAGVLSAALWAVLPISQDLLGWHGLANAAALALLPLVLLYVACLLAGAFGIAEAAGLGLLMVALAAAHRLSFSVGVAAVGLAIAVGLLGRGRMEVARRTAYSVAAALVLCPGVAYDLINRDRQFGGTQGYAAYASTKIQLTLLARDLTWVFSVVSIVAVLAALVWLRRERTVVPIAAMLAVVVALAYSWLVHFPLAYIRMAYFLPVALVPLVAVTATRLLRARLAALAGLALAVVVAVPAWGQARNVHDFYDFANPTTLRGLDAVSAQLRPGDVVVADRCWSFLSAWLLHASTLPALDPADILPKAEVGPASEARAIIAGTAKGRALARRFRVRFILTDPTCIGQSHRLPQPPRLGRPFFVSSKLVVMRLDRAPG